jgi:glycogen(starch) synthase
MERMKIALASAEYPPETGFGGLGSYVYKLAHSLTALGHYVTVVSSTRKETNVTLQKDGKVTVYRIPKPRYSLKGFGRSINNVIYSFRLHRILKQLDREQAIEVIQFPEYLGEGLFYSFLGRTPYVIRFSTPRWMVDELNQEHFLTARSRAMINHLIDIWTENTPARRGRSFIFPSRDLMDRMEHRIGLKGFRRVIYPGVDAARFRPRNDPDLRRKYGVDGSPVVLYVGRLEFRKGVHILAEAAARIAVRFPDAQFVFAGSDTKSAPAGGSMRAYMEQITREGRIEKAVKFIDGVGHKDIAGIYGIGDVLVVPSLYENLANVLLEGMAAGLPIITTSSGGSPEVVIHGTNGLIVPPGDPDALAGALSDLLTDSEALDRFSRNNREKALKDLSLERMARESLEVYTQLLGGSHG